jgi:signal peptidase I
VSLPPSGEPLTSVPVPVEGPPPTALRRHRRAAIEWAVILAVAVIAALTLRTFIIQPYFIPSGSMETTLDIGDKVLVNKLSYHLHAVHRGDVIVFKKPANDYSPGVKDLIKRVIGLPGETISGQGGSIYINGVVLKQSWLPKGTTTAPFPPTDIPAGHFFVMGDNRGNSSDSRVFGPIAKSLIVGRAFLLVWPPSRIGTL